uniref:hypothetical protein n=1 Tax=Clostridium sp. NkU-1 TaxID=1095009 RepID=UPI0032612001
MIPNIIGFKLKHFGDFFCLICPDIMKLGQKTDITKLLTGILPGISQHAGNDISHVRTVFCKPWINVTTEAPDNA